MRGIETVFVTPNGGNDPDLVFDPAEFHVVERDGVLEVHDPLFEEPYTIGNGSLIEDKTTEGVVLAAFEHFGIHGSTRQLSLTERFQIKTGTGRWTRMQHMISATALTATFGGTPSEIGTMALHDAGHRVRSHVAEGLLHDKASADLHDQELFDLLHRSGFADRLVTLGLADASGTLANNLSLHELVKGDDAPEGLINWPSKTGFLETERLQYIAHEMSVYMHSPSAVREMLGHVVRDRSAEHGDHLCLDDLDAARMLARGQARAYSEMWAEPVVNVMEELCAVLDRYVLATQTDRLGAHYPGDLLYSTEESWQEMLLDLEESDPAVRGLLKIITLLSSGQRKIHDDIAADARQYDGPKWPTYISTFNVGVPGRTATGPTARYYKRTSEHLVVEMGAGKIRAIDPLIKLPGEPLERLSSLAPDTVVYRERQTQWSNQPFTAVFDLSSRALGLSVQERRGLRRALSPNVMEQWETAMARPPMSREDFTDHIARAARDYRRRGTLQRPAPSSAGDLRAG